MLCALILDLLLLSGSLILDLLLLYGSLILDLLLLVGDAVLQPVSSAEPRQDENESNYEIASKVVPVQEAQGASQMTSRAGVRRYMR